MQALHKDSNSDLSNFTRSPIKDFKSAHSFKKEVSDISSGLKPDLEEQKMTPQDSVIKLQSMMKSSKEDNKSDSVSSKHLSSSSSLTQQVSGSLKRGKNLVMERRS